MPHAPIALIGYRGTGKTTVAKLLAEQLSYNWIDADVEVEQRAGKSIAEIFEASGEQVFRDFEAEVVADLCQLERTVLALGGGAVLREANQKNLAQCQQIVWLRASAKTIAQRLSDDPTTPGRRPNLTNRGGLHEIEQLLAAREPIYQTCPTLEVDTKGKDPTEIVDEIVGSGQWTVGSGQ